MPEVTYTGPKSKADISTEYQIEDEKGKVHVLRMGVATDVPAGLAKELLAGDGRVSGHGFEKAEAPAADGNTTSAASRS